jgi:hypothetical protein
VLPLTEEDDFNALASAQLADSIEGPVYRLGAPLPGHGVVAPYTGGETLFPDDLTRYEVGHRYPAGGTISTCPADGEIPAHIDLLFLVRANGALVPVTRTSVPAAEDGDTLVLLGPATADS